MESTAKQQWQWLNGESSNEREICETANASNLVLTVYTIPVFRLIMDVFSSWQNYT